MAKKRPRSEKQKANDKRLGAMARARGRKSRTTKRKSSKPRKTNKQRSPSKTMARRRSTPRKSRGFASKIPLINNPTFRKAAVGIGTATIGVAVLAAVAPQIAANPIVRPALAFLGGGLPGVIAQILAVGGIGSITNILGGNGGGNGAPTGGFA